MEFFEHLRAVYKDLLKTNGEIPLENRFIKCSFNINVEIIKIHGIQGKRSLLKKYFPIKVQNLDIVPQYLSTMNKERKNNEEKLLNNLFSLFAGKLLPKLNKQLKIDSKEILKNGYITAHLF